MLLSLLIVKKISPYNHVIRMLVIRHLLLIDGFEHLHDFFPCSWDFSCAVSRKVLTSKKLMLTFTS